MLAKLSTKDNVTTATDGVSGVGLDPALMVKARMVDMQFFDKTHVCDRVPRDHQRQH